MYSKISRTRFHTWEESGDHVRENKKTNKLLLIYRSIANMKTISAIYARCLTSLNDDWLSSPEGNGDMEDGAVCIYFL